MIRILVLALGLLLPTAVAAQTKPLRFVVPFAAGGAWDIVTRIVAQQIGPMLGQSVVVENRGGGAGVVGAEMVINAPPDGDTIIMAAQGQVTIAPWSIDKLSYNPEKDLVPITWVVNTPMVLMAAQSFPANSLQDFIGMAKAKPGALNYASFGIGGSAHLLMEILKVSQGVDLVHIPYRGASPALLEVSNGTVAVAFSSVASAKAFLDDGRLKAFAVANAQRTGALPAVPTMAELGVPGMAVPIWMGVMTRAGTPQARIAKLDEVIRAALEVPEAKQQILRLGADIIGDGPVKFEAMLREDRDRWAKLLSDSKINVKAE